MCQDKQRSRVRGKSGAEVRVCMSCGCWISKCDELQRRSRVVMLAGEAPQKITGESGWYEC